jgi:hypothetical protein
MKKGFASAKGSAISSQSQRCERSERYRKLTGDTVVSTMGKPSERRPGLKNQNNLNVFVKTF